MALISIKRFVRSLIDYAKIPTIAKIEALKDQKG
jgi:hypothetical protein